VASKQRPRPGGTQARTTKAERKEQARRERIEIQQRMKRARRNRTIAIAGIVVVGVALVAALGLTSSKDTSGGSPAPEALPGIMSGPEPWSANTNDLAARLTGITLPPVGGALHIHSHLDLFVNGSRVPVPADIGISSDAESPLHTHDETGVVHEESADPNSTFTLGEFFDVWGLKLTPTCIGGYCDAGDKTLSLFVEGKPYDGDPRTLRLNNEEEIVIAYGTKDQVPSPLPTFDWSTLSP
jgi:hypothetical protein